MASSVVTALFCVLSVKVPPVPDNTSVLAVMAPVCVMVPVVFRLTVCEAAPIAPAAKPPVSDR